MRAVFWLLPIPLSSLVPCFRPCFLVPIPGRLCSGANRHTADFTAAWHAIFAGGTVSRKRGRAVTAKFHGPPIRVTAEVTCRNQLACDKKSMYESQIP
jgi:hypothetical protein